MFKRKFKQKIEKVKGKKNLHFSYAWIITATCNGKLQFFFFTFFLISERIRFYAFFFILGPCQLKGKSLMGQNRHPLKKNLLFNGRLFGGRGVPPTNYLTTHYDENLPQRISYHDGIAAYTVTITAVGAWWQFSKRGWRFRGFSRWFLVVEKW